MYNNIMSQNVLDSWADWDDWGDVEPSNKTLNKQQHKILEERKLAEDADNVLTENLFSVTQEKTNEPEFKKSLKTTERSKEVPEKPEKPEKQEKPEKHKESFNKTQKNLSIKIKNRNQSQKKQNEIFGKCDDNTYVKYCEIEEKYLD